MKVTGGQRSVHMQIWFDDNEDDEIDLEPTGRQEDGGRGISTLNICYCDVDRDKLNYRLNAYNKDISLKLFLGLMQSAQHQEYTGKDNRAISNRYPKDIQYQYLEPE